MSSEVIAALIGMVGLIIGAFPTYLFMRKKNLAEIEKITAETDKIKAEAEKIRVELQNGKTSNKSFRSYSELRTKSVLNFAARREAITQSQGSILRYVVIESATGQYVSQDTIVEKFNQYSRSELFYRLECLRLLGFLESQKIGKDIKGTDLFSYRISEDYKKELGNNILAVLNASATS